jgi:hypothetical protein
MMKRADEARLATYGPPGFLWPPQARDVDARLAALEAMTTADLRLEWRRLCCTTPPTRLSRDLLLRGTAYKIQEQAYGGLSLSTKRRLQSLAGVADQRTSAAASPAAILRPGTKLVREWRGRVHTVLVLEDGFDYQDARYRSLSRIARQITGVHRSGPLFFGISRVSARRAG